MHLHLLTPALTATASDVSPDLLKACPSLARLLGLGARQSSPLTGLDDWCQSLFTDTAGLAAHRAWADMREPDSPDAWLIAADPCHIAVHQEGTQLIGAHGFSLSRDEAEALQDSLNHFLRDDGLKLIGNLPQHWYLCGGAEQGAEQIEWLAAHRQYGLDIGDSPLTSRDPALQKRWKRWLTEWQMLLYQHPVNDARAQQGLPVINHLLLHGGGTRMPCLAKPSDAPPPLIVANQSTCVGMADWLSWQRADLPTHLDRQWFIEHGDTAENCILVLDALEAPFWYGDYHTWDTTVRHWEAAFFAPLLAMVQSGLIKQMTWTAPSRQGAWQRTYSPYRAWSLRALRQRWIKPSLSF